jgi:alpha-maltose-1-phosphate synthase
MKVVYTAPNRGHHYRYASALHKAGVLHKFISGFSRFSPRAAFPEIGDHLYRADFLQTIYLASLKFRFPEKAAAQLAYLAKKEQDRASRKFAGESDIFMFYNGGGLNTCKYIQKKGGLGVVEAVNSHVLYQQEILKNEHKSLNIPWTPFHKQETARRLKEYEQADYILMPSEFVKKSFLEYGFAEEKLVKVPYGFTNLAGKASAVPGTQSGEFKVLYVGSISVRKGVHYLIEAFQKLKHPKKQLYIVGPEAQPNGINNIAIPENVFFTGPLKGKELEEAYRTATVFCLPSIEEGLALVLGEALSFGLPIVTTVNTGATDIITDGKEGFIVPIQDANVIYERLQQLADDKDLYKRMREAATLKVQTLGGWDATGELLVSSLLKIHERNKR